MNYSDDSIDHDEDTESNHDDDGDPIQDKLITGIGRQVTVADQDKNNLEEASFDAYTFDYPDYKRDVPSYAFQGQGNFSDGWEARLSSTSRILRGELVYLGVYCSIYGAGRGLFPLLKQRHLMCRVAGMEQMKKNPKTAPLMSMKSSILTLKYPARKHTPTMMAKQMISVILMLPLSDSLSWKILKNLFLRYTMILLSDQHKFWVNRIKVNKVDTLDDVDFPSVLTEVSLYCRLVAFVSMITAFPYPYISQQIPTEPIQAIQRYAADPRMQASMVQKTYFSDFGFFFSTGIKKDWIEKAPPIAAAKFTAPSPKALQSTESLPCWQVAITHIRNIRQDMILIMPQDMMLAPNSRYFSRNTSPNKTKALTRGLMKLNSWGGIKPYHWKIINSKQRRSIKTKQLQTQKSQNILGQRAPLKWRRMAQSRSGWSPMWIMQRQQEQKLKSPVKRMTMRLSKQPACRVQTGRSRMSPPIMPLTMPSTVMGALRISFLSVMLSWQYKYFGTQQMRIFLVNL